MSRYEGLREKAEYCYVGSMLTPRIAERKCFVSAMATLTGSSRRPGEEIRALCRILAALSHRTISFGSGMQPSQQANVYWSGTAFVFYMLEIKNSKWKLLNCP